LYSWDAENRLVRVMSWGSVDRRRVDWTYDAMGRRVRQVRYVWTNSTWQVVEDLKLVSDPVWFGRHIAELNGTNGAVVRSYVWGLDLSESLDGAGGVGGLLWVRLSGGAAAGVHFVTYDGNGNVWNLVSASAGTETARYEYGPFGEPLRMTGPVAGSNPFRFSTKYQDAETGLLYYGYRYYNPSTGRWLSRDPIEEEGGFNLYAFVGNAPVNYVDPFGERTISVETNAFETPSGISLSVRGVVTRTTCPVEVEGSVFIAVEWEPPSLQYIKKLFRRFNVHIEAGARGGGRVKLNYSECSGLAATKGCLRFEVFGQAEYRAQRVRDHRGRYTRLRFGFGADGGGEICLDLCTGDFTMEAAFSWYAYLNFGNERYNRTYSWGDSYSGSWKLGNAPGWALLRDYCNKAPDPNSCCCIKKYGRSPASG
jgi:RHS repeat-associated protein